MQKTLQTLLTKHTPKSNEVQGSPWDVIAIKNIKQAKNTTQAYLGNRKISKLVKFQDFTNLQVLWINQNNLQSLEGLQKNFRIKHIYAQQNKIKSVDKIFENLKHIQTLVVYDNELRDLQRILKNLKQLKNLKHLDLFNNPASYEPNYKYRVISSLLTLEILDRHKISQREKVDAVSFMSNNHKKNKKRFL